MNGTLVCLHGGDDRAVMEARVEPAGGKVLQAKTDIASGSGFCALFLDTEGNKLGLHAMKQSPFQERADPGGVPSHPDQPQHAGAEAGGAPPMVPVHPGKVVAAPYFLRAALAETGLA